MFRKLGLLAVAVLGLTAVAPGPASAAVARPYPAEFSLPDGFHPEGIAVSGGTAYFGSEANGALYRVDLRTGHGALFGTAPGTPSVGLKVDSRQRIFVAGGEGGDGRVVDARTGRVLAHYQFATGGTNINDVLLTGDAVWFTDSSRPVLYKLPLGPFGELPQHAVVVPMTGAFSQVPGAINANGITTTPDGQALLVVQSNTGKLFRVDPRTGSTAQADLGPTALPFGDGLLRQGSSLYVVLPNFTSTVDKIRLNPAGTAGFLERTVTDARFDTPTTTAAFGDRLYLVNARVLTPPEPATPYNVVAIPKP